MIKNITLSAEQHMIEAARLKAKRESRSLNDAFREWLANYIGQEKKATVAEIFDRIGPRKNLPWTRDEINERR